MRWLFLGSAMLLLGVVGALAVLTAPVDVSESLAVPGQVDRFFQRDGFAYRAHRWLGTGLEWLGFPADRAGTQWYKAAYHARTPSEVDRARRHFLAARDRAPEQFARGFCRYVGAAAPRRAQGELLAAADLRCGAA